MRIIAGEKRGMILSSPEGRDVRPTKDNVREAVFGSIQFDMPGCTFLDLFSGSGAVGIEALSRGAAFVCCSDISRQAITVINKNIESAGYSDRSTVINGDYSTVLKMMSGRRLFDFVYVDPPYSAGIYEDVLRLSDSSGILAENAVLILESDHELDICPMHYELLKRKRYGKCHITFMRYCKDE